MKVESMSVSSDDDADTIVPSLLDQSESCSESAQSIAVTDIGESQSSVALDPTSSSLRLLG